MADYKQEMLRAMRRYCKQTGLSPSTVATLAANKRDFFERMENPKISCTMKTYTRVMAWFAKNGKTKPVRKSPIITQIPPELGSP